MADEPPIIDEGTAQPVDPFEAELVAYLDGELEPSAARKVEARLASDPGARARAAALKKTFDLLDYLPKREPSPTFASRTLERLPAAKSGATPSRPSTATQASQAPSEPIPQSASVSASGQAAAGTLSGGSIQSAIVPRTPWELWAAVLVVMLVACLAGGYVAVDLARSRLMQPVAGQPHAEELQIADHRIVENLPLYAVVDHLAFLQELAKPDLFGEDPIVAIDPATKPPTIEPDKPTGPSFTSLATEFKALPPARRQAIRELDKQLFAIDPRNREQLFRVLEAYAIWLDRLPEAERARVLALETPARRLEEIRGIRNRQWFDALPSTQRAKLKGLPPDKQADLIRQWKDEENTRRDDLVFQKTYAEDIASNKIPWPFDHPERRKEVTDFMRQAYHLDDDKVQRLSEADRTRYNSVLAAANERGGWFAWYAYGRTVHELVKKYEVLPEPATGTPITSYAQLGSKGERWLEKGRGRTLTLPYVGKWPEFALAVHSYLGTEKGEKVQLPPLGPARPTEFKEPLRTFVTRDLLPALSAADRKSFESIEGKWPEYPRELIRLAKQCDLSVPGVTPPGSPKRWENLYGNGPRLRP
jgi:anti-sigma factor RsiW